MATTIDITPVTAVINTGTVAAPVAIDADTTLLLITPTVPCHKLILILTNGGATYNIDITAGDYWAGRAMTTVAMAGECRVFVFESARFVKKQYASDGSTYGMRIGVTLGAAATTTTYYTVIQLP